MGDLVLSKWNKDFSFDLLPSANDGGSICTVSSRLARHELNASLKVYYVVSRYSRCSFYKPEFDAVFRRYGELKKANRPNALNAYKKGRNEFVRKSFEVGAT